MRTLAIGDGAPLKLTSEQRSRLQNYLISQHRDALDQRFGVEKMWQRCDNSYIGQSPADPHWTPYKEAPVIEVTIGAMCTDSVAAQANDLIFQTRPILTIRPTKEEFEKHADALQKLIDIEVQGKAWNFRGAATEGIMDVCKKGNVVWYVPFTKTVRKTDLRQVVTFGPRMYCLPLEDFIIPPNSSKDIQATRFATMRIWYGRKDLRLKALLNNWHIDDAVGGDSNAPRYTRLRAAGLAGISGEKYEEIAIADTFCYFDLDDDGIESDLEVIWNMTSGGILKVMYNRYDCRPFVMESYQEQPHTWVGLGIMQMAEPYERMATELWNNHIWNAYIANMKLVKGPATAMQEATQIYPGMFFDTSNGDVEMMDMGNVNTAAVNAVTMILAMVRERVGTQLLNQPVRNTSRTPANTYAMMSQAANRRFTPAFDNMRNGLADATMQCIYRIQEQVKGGSMQKQVKQWLLDVLGDEDGELVIDLLTQKRPLIESVEVQLTAASVSVNREADRQNLMQLASQVYPLYFQAVEKLVVYIGQPPVPGADKVAKDMGRVLNKIMHKLVKTYDQVEEMRNITVELDELQPQAQMLGIAPELQGMQNAVMGQNGAAPMQ